MNRRLKGIYGFIGTIVATVVATLITDVVKGDVVFSSLCKLLKRMLCLLQERIPVWVSLSVIVFACFIFLMLRIVRDKIKPVPPAYTKYRRYNYNGYIWEWDWIERDGKWLVEDIHPCCPYDGTRIASDYSCPKCGKIYHNIQGSPEKIAILIHERIKRGDF